RGGLLYGFDGVARGLGGRRERVGIGRLGGDDEGVAARGRRDGWLTVDGGESGKSVLNLGLTRSRRDLEFGTTGELDAGRHRRAGHEKPAAENREREDEHRQRDRGELAVGIVGVIDCRYVE